MHYNYFQLNGNIFCSFLITLLYFALKEEIIFIFNFVLITLTTNACANYFGWNFNYVQLLLHYEIISHLQFYFHHIDDKRMRKLLWLKFQLISFFFLHYLASTCETGWVPYRNHCYYFAVDTLMDFHGAVVGYYVNDGEVYSIQHYVIKFVSDLRQVCGFLHQ